MANTRIQIAMGFIIFFICEIFVISFLPNPHYTAQNVDMTGVGSVYINAISNFQDLGWWNTLIFAPFGAFVVFFILGLVPTVNVGS